MHLKSELLAWNISIIIYNTKHATGSCILRPINPTIKISILHCIA